MCASRYPFWLDLYVRRAVPFCRPQRGRRAMVRQIVIEAETPGDSRTMFRLRIDAMGAERRLAASSAARRSTNAMASQPRRSSSDRRAGAGPAHLRDQPSPSSSLPPSTLRDASCRRDSREPSPGLKSRSRSPNQPPSSPRFPPWEAFRRRAPHPAPPSHLGPASETLRLSGNSSRAIERRKSAVFGLLSVPNGQDEQQPRLDRSDRSQMTIFRPSWRRAARSP